MVVVIVIAVILLCHVWGIYNDTVKYYYCYVVVPY